MVLCHESPSSVRFKSLDLLARTLMAVLQLEKIDIDEILNNCSYSKSFISTANDLQILDAISQCYEQYRVLNRGRD